MWTRFCLPIKTTTKVFTLYTLYHPHIKISSLDTGPYSGLNTNTRLPDLFLVICSTTVPSVHGNRCRTSQEFYILVHSYKFKLVLSTTNKTSQVVTNWHYSELFYQQPRYLLPIVSLLLHSLNVLRFWFWEAYEESLEETSLSASTLKILEI